jgi:hypothetical protein
MTSIRDYIESVRNSLNLAERELAAEADNAPGFEIGAMLAHLKWEAEQVALLAKYEDAR